MDGYVKYEPKSGYTVVPNWFFVLMVVMIVITFIASGIGVAAFCVYMMFPVTNTGTVIRTPIGLSSDGTVTGNDLCLNNRCLRSFFEENDAFRADEADFRTRFAENITSGAFNGLPGADGATGPQGPIGDINYLPQGQSHIIWVTKGGIDNNGTGTAAQPYATVKYALERIEGSSNTKRYTIQIGPGIFLETGAGTLTIPTSTTIIGSGSGATQLGSSSVNIIPASSSASFGFVDLRLQCTININSSITFSGSISFARVITGGDHTINPTHASSGFSYSVILSEMFGTGTLSNLATLTVRQSALARLDAKGFACTLFTCNPTFTFEGSVIDTLIINSTDTGASGLSGTFIARLYGTSVKTALVLQSAVNTMRNLTVIADPQAIPSTVILINPGNITTTLRQPVFKSGSLTLNSSGAVTVLDDFANSMTNVDITFTPLPFTGGYAYTIIPGTGFYVTSADGTNTNLTATWTMSKSSL